MSYQRQPTSTTLKVELTVKEEDGRVIVKTLEGEDAARWSEFIAQVCGSAYVRGKNPDWESLNWQKKEMQEQ
jgi:hypothetical protein